MAVAKCADTSLIASLLLGFSFQVFADGKDGTIDRKVQEEELEQLARITIDNDLVKKLLIRVDKENIEVYDGDTIKHYYDKAKKGGEYAKLRFISVDTPELKNNLWKKDQHGNGPSRFLNYGRVAKDYVAKAIDEAIEIAYLVVAKDSTESKRPLVYILARYEGYDENTWDILQVNLICAGLSGQTIDTYGGARKQLDIAVLREQYGDAIKDFSDDAINTAYGSFLDTLDQRCKESAAKVPQPNFEDPDEWRDRETNKRDGSKAPHTKHTKTKKINNGIADDRKYRHAYHNGAQYEAPLLSHRVQHRI